MEELSNLKYSQLQKLAKKHAIKANQKAAVLRELLQAVLLQETELVGQLNDNSSSPRSVTDDVDRKPDVLTCDQPSSVVYTESAPASTCCPPAVAQSNTSHSPDPNASSRENGSVVSTCNSLPLHLNELEKSTNIDKYVLATNNEEKMVATDAEEQVLTIDSEKQMCAIDIEEQVLATNSEETERAADSEEQLHFTNHEKQMLATNSEEQVFAAHSKKNVLAADSEEQVFAADSEEQLFSADTGKNFFGTDSEKRMLATDGAAEALITDCKKRVIATDHMEKVLATDSKEKVRVTEQVIATNNDDQVLATDNEHEVFDENKGRSLTSSKKNPVIAGDDIDRVLLKEGNEQTLSGGSDEHAYDDTSNTSNPQLTINIDEGRKRRRSGTYELESPSVTPDIQSTKRVRLSSVQDLPVIDSPVVSEVGRRRRRSGTYELESPSATHDNQSSKKIRLSSVQDLPVIDSPVVPEGAKDENRREDVVKFTADESTTGCPSENSDWMQQLMNRVNKAAQDQESEIERQVDEKMAALNPSTSQHKIKSNTPNFNRLHEKHFSKMKDITEYHNRKMKWTNSRAPTGNSSSKIPCRTPAKLMAKGAQPSTTKDSHSRREGYSKGTVLSARKDVATVKRGGAKIIKPIQGGGGNSAVKAKVNNAVVHRQSGASALTSKSTQLVSKSLFSPTVSSRNKSLSLCSSSASKTPSKSVLGAAKTSAFTTGTHSASDGLGSSQRPPLKSVPQNRKTCDVKEITKSKANWNRGPTHRVANTNSGTVRRVSALQDNLNKRKQLTMANRGLTK